MRLTEKAITAAVLDHWRIAGVPGSVVAAIPNQFSFGQFGLTAGLFDLLVIRPPGFVAFLELKTLTGKPSAAQLAFADKLSFAGIPHAITYGRDEPISQLQAWGVIRQ